MNGVVTALRDQLAAGIRDALGPRVTVYPTSVGGVAVFPSVVLGMPSWKPLNGCWGLWEFPVAVIVSRPGTSDEGSVTQLDELWPDVLDALIVLRDRQPQEITDVTRAEFGLFNVRGTDYPAQVLTCTLATT